MGAKVTFNELTKIISITQAPVNGEVVIDVKRDLYSDGKEDWVAFENLRKFRFPVRAVGGDPLPGAKSLGSTFFLASDWKIKPYEASHRLIINGNLYSEDGSSPFVTTDGSFNIFLEQQVSSLVDSTIQQLPEIEYASFNGGITLDTANGTPGVDYPAGTPQQPVDNLTDAMAIAVERGFGTIYVLGDATIDSGGDYAGMIFIGESQTKSTLTISAAANVLNAEFYEATIEGTLDGNAKLRECQIANLTFVTGFVEQCVLSAGTIVLGGNAAAHFLDCWSGVPGTGTPTIDLGGSGQALALRNYNGGIRLTNKSGNEAVSVDLNSGQIILDDTVDAGDVVMRGVGKWTNQDTYQGNANVLNELVEGHHIQDTHAAHFNRRTRNPATGDEVIYEADGVTPRHSFTTTDDGAQITEVNPV